MECQEIRFRNKITVVQFLLSIGIVYQHTQWNYSDNSVLNIIQSFLFYIIESCVPFFFMISGYLFFRTFDIKNVKKKYLSRCRTLLVPYILWNILYAAFMIIMVKIGFVKNIFISDNIGGVLFQIINSEFSPLWFIKYLMIFTLISPLAYFLLRRKYIGILTLLAMIMINAFSYYFGYMKIPIDVNSNSIIMLNYQYIYYAVGGYCALNLKKLLKNQIKDMLLLE